MIQFKCQGCNKAYNVPDEYAGKKVRCKKCDSTNRIPSSEETENVSGSNPSKTNALSKSMITKDCPNCAEKILEKAIKCQHCGELLGQTVSEKSKIRTKVARGGIFLFAGSYEDAMNIMLDVMLQCGGTIESNDFKSGNIEAKWKLGINLFGSRVKALFIDTGKGEIRIAILPSFLGDPVRRAEMVSNAFVGYTNIGKDKYELEQNRALSNIFIGHSIAENHLEKKYIAEVVNDGETIQAIVSGKVREMAPRRDGRHTFGDVDTIKGGLRKHYLIVTDSRVIFWARGFISSSTDAFDYEDIKSVEMQKALLTGSIVLNIYGKTEHFTDINKPEVPIIVGLIRNNIKIAKNKNHEAENTNQEKTEIDIVSQIERLASLKDKGILSEEEFTAMKQKLLGSD